jgi:beta-1,4-N-acetylglucosaminyltransferase
MAAPQLERVCLVTVGATAGFKKLIDSVLLPSFWQYISSQGFTKLHIQCGPDVVWASKQLILLKDDVPLELTIDIFDVKKNLMKEEMILCKGVADKRQLGLVISHAGMPNRSTLQTYRLTQFRHWNHIGCLEDGVAHYCGA